MSTEDSNSTTDPNAIPWYKSRIIIGIVISLVCKALVVSGVAKAGIDSDTQAQLLNLVLMLIGGGGDLFALAKRITQQSAPAIAATAKRADVLDAKIEAAKPVADPAPVQDVPQWMQ
jgi:hypothetical protein